MPAHGRFSVVYGQVAWMLAALVALTLFGTFSLEAFAVLSVIGLLVVVQLTEPSTVSPAWRDRLRWLLLVGLLGLAYLVVRRALEALPGGPV